MGCEICGRGSCTRSFHALEEQQSFDDTADNVKDRLKSEIEYKLGRLSCEDIGDVQYVKLDDVQNIIDCLS